MATASRKTSAYETQVFEGDSRQRDYGNQVRKQPSAPSFQPPLAEEYTLSVRSSSPEDTSNDGEGSVELTNNVLAEETSGLQTEEAEEFETGETRGLHPEQHEDPEDLEFLDGTETVRAGPMEMLRSRNTGEHWIRTPGGRTFEATPTGIALFGNILDSVPQR